MLEYKVIDDWSGKPDALEKIINDMVREGWHFAHVTTCSPNGGQRATYLFFEREV